MRNKPDILPPIRLDDEQAMAGILKSRSHPEIIVVLGLSAPVLKSAAGEKRLRKTAPFDRIEHNQSCSC
jgi:hypothetical protein